MLSAAEIAVSAAALPVTAMLGVGYLGYKDITSQKGDYEAARARQQQDVAAAADMGTDVVTLRRLRAHGVSPDSSQPLPMLNSREMADAVASAIAKQTLRVQSVTAPAAPPGQGQPL